MYIGSSKLSEHISYRSYAFWGHEWEDEMGQTCGTYGAVVNCRIISTGEPQKKDALLNLRADGRATLNWILKIGYEMMD